MMHFCIRTIYQCTLSLAVVKVYRHLISYKNGTTYPSTASFLPYKFIATPITYKPCLILAKFLSSSVLLRIIFKQRRLNRKRIITTENIRFWRWMRSAMARVIAL